MRRLDMLARLDERREPWDMLIIGGGATGAGIAVDAASRGYEVALLEQHDFGKGTSSRSTKLVHGGVRYLEQGNLSLVMEALKERGLLRQNAPHLVSNLAFVVPNYDWWEAPFYGLGLKIYNTLAGKYGFGPSEILTREETLQRLPTIKTDGLRGGVVYYDGQFDDARLLINLVETAADLGATLVNYVRVVAITRGADGFVDGVVAADQETGQQWTLAGRAVVNATGPFADSVRRMVEPEAHTLMAPSQGIHLVFHHSFLSSESAIMVPHTADGRVMFAIPWHGHALVGTTDTPIATPTLEPRPMQEEIDFILDTAGRYLSKPPTRADVLSVFVGIRPLVKSGDATLTAALSRDHTIHIDSSGLLTTTGGKWTTYRNMAEHTVDQAADLARLPERPCVTRTLNVHGYHPAADRFGALSVYGSDAPPIQDLMRSEPALAAPLHDQLPYTGAEVVWATRHEMARTVEDVLARRTRALFLNARAAEAMGPDVARLMAKELGWDRSRESAEVSAFSTLAKGYQIVAAILFLVLAAATARAQSTQANPQPDTGRVVVTITLESLRIPAVNVELRHVDDNVVLGRTSSDGIGQVTFPDIPPGRYVAHAVREGFADAESTPFTVQAGETAQVSLEMQLTFVRESVEVIVPSNSPTESLQTVAVSDVLNGAKMDVQPLAGDDFQSLLTVLPSIIRGPEGRLRIKGGAPTTGALQMSSASLNDPSTGDFDLELPSGAVESVEVLANPFAAEYGRFSTSITQVRTKRGTNEWTIKPGNLMPSLGKGAGIFRRFEPRLSVSGPLKRDRLLLGQHVQYRFARTPVESLPDEPSLGLDSFDSFTRLDAVFSSRHSLTGGVIYFPRKITNATLSTFRPPEATPDFTQEGFATGGVDRLILSDHVVLESTMSFRTFDFDVRRDGDRPMVYAPQSQSGNFFNLQDRKVHSLQIVEVLSISRERWLGQHVFKVGFDLQRSRFDGTSVSGQLDVVRLDGSLAERTDL